MKSKLDELLEGNPEAKAEFDEKIKAAAADGVKAFREGMGTVMKIAVSAVYPTPIRELAAKVLNDEEPRAALTAAVASFDATTEKGKGEEAKKEGDKLPPTGGDGPSGLSEDGFIRTAEDHKAAIDRLKQGV